MFLLMTAPGWSARTVRVAAKGSGAGAAAATPAAAIKVVTKKARARNMGGLLPQGVYGASGTRVTGPRRPEGRGFQAAAVKSPCGARFSGRRAGKLTL